MKVGKSSFALIALLVVNLSAAAEELEMGTVNFQYYSKLTNQTEKGVLRVIYDDVADRLMLFLARPAGTAKLKFSMADVGKLRANLEKFVEWEKLAIAKSVELKKPLPDSAIACPLEWDDKGKAFTAPSITLSFDFLSRTKLVHWLQIGSNEAKAEAGSILLDLMYLDKPAALHFLDVISDKNVAAKRKTREEQKAVEGLFQ